MRGHRAIWTMIREKILGSRIRSFLSANKKLFQFYYGTGPELSLICTQPRSGWNTTSAMLRSCFCSKYGVDPSICVTEEKYRTFSDELIKPIDVRGIFQTPSPCVWHSHLP